MGDITAIAAMPKTTRAPDSQSAPDDAAAGIEAMLFATLLAQAGDGDAAGDLAGDATQDQADAALTTQPPAVAQNSADGLEDAMAVPRQGTLPLALLQAQFEDADTQTQTQSQADSADAGNALADLDAADPTETAPPPDEQETLLHAQEPKAEKNAAAKPEMGDVVVDATASSVAGVGAQLAQTTTTQATQQVTQKPTEAATGAVAAAAPLANAAPVAKAQADSAVAAPGTAQESAADVKAGKTSDPAAQGAVQDAIQDAKALPADKAAALADMADKTVRQATADTVVQARALPPVQGAAQAPAPHHGDDGKSGSKEHQLAQGQQPAPGSANASAQADPQQVAQPASTTHNSAQGSGAPSAAAVTAPTLAQAQAPAPATVQVAQQAPLPPPPDLSALALQIATQSRDGAQLFSIRLDPAELGRVDVRLSIDHTGHAQAHLSVEKAQTLDLLQRDRTELERALKDSGIDLSQSGLNFSLKGQERHGEQPMAFKGRSRTLQASLALDTASAAASASTHYFAGGTSRLDIRV